MPFKSSKSNLSYSAGSKKYNSAVIPESSKRELELSLVQYVSKMNAKRTLFKLKVFTPDYLGKCCL